MSREDIIRMAREVGIEFDPGWGTCFTGNVQLERFAALVAAAARAEENEACAKVCEGLFQEPPPYTTYAEAIARDCADAIRARGEQ